MTQSQSFEEEFPRNVSVSLSPLFSRLLIENDFSPTEVFRVGMAVMLCEKGDITYKTPLNIERLGYVREKLEELKHDEKFNSLMEEKDKIIRFFENLQKIKVVIDGITKD